MAVTIELDVMLARRTTLDAICRVLDCQPGDVLRWTADRLHSGDAFEAAPLHRRGSGYLATR